MACTVCRCEVCISVILEELSYLFSLFFFWFLSPFRDRLHVQENFGGIGSYTEGSFTGEIKES